MVLGCSRWSAIVRDWVGSFLFVQLEQAAIETIQTSLAKHICSKDSSRNRTSSCDFFSESSYIHESICLPLNENFQGCRCICNCQKFWTTILKVTLGPKPNNGLPFRQRYSKESELSKAYIQSDRKVAQSSFALASVHFRARYVIQFQKASILGVYPPRLSGFQVNEFGDIVSVMIPI